MAGDRSVSVVIPLTQLYLQFGDVEKAVQLMESFVDENPNDVAALKRLGKFFQYAERPHDYLTILERIAALEPGEAYFRELSDIYNFNAQYEKQIEILKTLIDKYPNRPQDFIDLAKLEALMPLDAKRATVGQDAESAERRAAEARDELKAAHRRWLAALRWKQLIRNPSFTAI